MTMWHPLNFPQDPPYSISDRMTLLVAFLALDLGDAADTESGSDGPDHHTNPTLTAIVGIHTGEKIG